MSGWDDLTAELDAWQRAGEAATLWWRDDDATEATPDLEHLLACAEQDGLPLALAVIPARCHSGLAARLARMPRTIQVLQHGYAHLSHGRAGEKKIELGPQRSKAAVREELARGWVRLSGLFGRRLLPVLVPPWNRIDPLLPAELPALGLKGLSTYEPRTTAQPVKGLWQTNTHVDIMRWKEPRGFLGEEEVLSLLRGNLRSRRTVDGSLDPEEPTGILTHHLAHDEAAWDFLSRLLALLAEHPGCRFVTAAEAFCLPDAVEGSAA